MRILITGITGFIGSAFAHKLIKDDKHIIYGLVHNKSSSNTWRINDIYSEIFPCYADLSNYESISHTIKGCSPEVIIHLSTYGVHPNQSDFNEIIKTNIIGTYNLLEATKHINYKCFINIGSASEYGVRHYSSKEDDPINPNNSYAFSKASQTAMCQQFAKDYKKPINTFRLYNVYGPQEAKTRLIPTILDNIDQNKPLNMSSPDLLKDFTYVDDIVDICTNFDKLQSLSDKIFNIGTGTPVTLKQIVNITFELTGKKVDCTWGNITRPWDSPCYVANCTKTKKILNWEAKTDILQGIKKVIQYHNENRSSGNLL